MKGMLLAACLVVLLAGTAHASLYTDPSSVWGAWAGILTATDSSSGSSTTDPVSWTFGGNLGSHMPGAGYVFIPLSIYPGDFWTDTLLDEGGDEYSYWASVSSLEPDILHYSELATDLSWGGSLELEFLFDSAGNPTGLTLAGVATHSGGVTLLSGTFAPISSSTVTPSTPIPGAVWLLGAGLAGLYGMRRKKMSR